MRSFTTTIAPAVLLAVIAGGCASDSAQRKPDSYQDIRQRELQSERAEYIEDAERRLAEIENDIGRLNARLEHESEFASTEEQASWSHELFELEQQRDQVQAQLERARTASPEEWSEMRGDIGGALDSLQAGASKLQIEVSQAFSGGGEEKLAASSGLCPLMVNGAEAEVEQRGEQIVVEVTTDDQAGRRELQIRAQQMANSSTYRPGQQLGAKAQPEKKEDLEAQPSGGAEGIQQPVDVDVRAENIDNGVRLVFEPKKGDAERLRSQLEEDAERLDEGDCAAE